VEVFTKMLAKAHENLLFLQHRESGLRGVLAIHDSSLGPAIGGIRFREYPSEQEMILDALQLSESSSLTAALFGCDAGGGKVVVGMPPAAKNEAMLRALGAFIEGLNGRYIATEGFGISKDDLLMVSKETGYVAGVTNPASAVSHATECTATGAYWGLKAAMKVAFGDSSLKNRSIALQGLGKVGLVLLKKLVEEGARVTVSDLRFERVKAAKDQSPEIELVRPEELMKCRVDAIVPCAAGGVLTPEVVAGLHCKVIAGPASKQLGSEDVAELLAQSGIIFVPDFLLSSGDIIVADTELKGYPVEMAHQKAESVFGMVEQLLACAREKKAIPYQIARETALARMIAVRSLKKIYRPHRENSCHPGTTATLRHPWRPR
jgi:leucine dehydrogenase